MWRVRRSRLTVLEHVNATVPQAAAPSSSAPTARARPAHPRAHREMRHRGDIDIMIGGRNGKPLRLGCNAAAHQHRPGQYRWRSWNSSSWASRSTTALARHPPVAPGAFAGTPVDGQGRAPRLAPPRNLSGAKCSASCWPSRSAGPKRWCWTSLPPRWTFQGEHLFCELLDELRAARRALPSSWSATIWAWSSPRHPRHLSQAPRLRRKARPTRSAHAREPHGPVRHAHGTDQPRTRSLRPRRRKTAMRGGSRSMAVFLLRASRSACGLISPMCMPNRAMRFSGVSTSSGVPSAKTWRLGQMTWVAWWRRPYPDHWLTMSWVSHWRRAARRAVRRTGVRPESPPGGRLVQHQQFGFLEREGSQQDALHFAPEGSRGGAGEVLGLDHRQEFQRMLPERQADAGRADASGCP